MGHFLQLNNFNSEIKIVLYLLRIINIKYPKRGSLGCKIAALAEQTVHTQTQASLTYMLDCKFGQKPPNSNLRGTHPTVDIKARI